MESLVLKLLLTPTLIGVASLAGRRWGSAVSGWLVGLPFTSGPIIFFLALNEGVSFARAAAVGTLMGALSQAAFCLAYGRLAPHIDWPAAILASSLLFLALTLALQPVSLPLVSLFIIVMLTLALAFRLMPSRPGNMPLATGAPPAWDIPARMITATTFVLLLTGLASTLGPRLTGLLAPFPLYATILAVFAHQARGPHAAVDVLKGLLLGLFAFASFFLILAALIEPAGITSAFAAALAAALLVQGGSLWLLRHLLRP